MAVTSTTLDRAIDKLGSPYTIYIGSYTRNDYGFGSVTFTGSVATGYVQVVNQTDEIVREGGLQVGDAIGYFKVDSSFPQGSPIEIDHQGVRFETFGEQIIPHLSGAQLMKQVTLRRKVLD